MSLLMFFHEDESVAIVTDTLATSLGEPFMFQSKVYFFPHANMVIAATGVANVAEQWAATLRGSGIFRSIDDVASFATESLQKIEREILGESAGQAGMSTTIYHFGFEQGASSPVRHIYRSTSAFALERYDDPGFGIKPTPSGILAAPQSLDEIIELAERVRQEWRAKDDPIHIGGELFLTYVRNGHQESTRLHMFDDYDEAWAHMLRAVTDG